MHVAITGSTSIDYDFNGGRRSREAWDGIF
jgi:hypothetical protein